MPQQHQVPSGVEDRLDAIHIRLEQRLEATQAADVVANDLHRLAIDIVGGADDGELRPDQKEMLHRSMMRAIGRIDATFRQYFVAALTDALVDVPNDVWDRLALAETRRHLGYD